MTTLRPPSTCPSHGEPMNVLVVTKVEDGGRVVRDPAWMCADCFEQVSGKTVDRPLERMARALWDLRQIDPRL